MNRPRGVLLAVVLSALFAALAGGAETGLTREERAIVEWLATQEQAMAGLLERSVKIDSATENLAGVRAVGELYAAELKAMGLAPRWVELPATMKRAGHLLAERTGTKGRRLLLIGHLDTVLPGGSFTREGEVGRGSGANDMKGGNAVLIFALKALQVAGALEGRQIVVVLTGDEEALGEPVEASRRELIAAGRRSDVALAFETARGGEATIARRGASSWRLEVQGPVGHSSAIFSGVLGSGAVYEAARILEGFHTELRKLPGLTASVAVLAGGAEVKEDGWSMTADGIHNVMPGRVVARGDLRAVSPEQLAQAEALMREIVAKHRPRTHAALTLTHRYPPMAMEPRHRELLATYNAVSQALGQGAVLANNAAERGAGDSAFVAPHCAVLDGLGPYGGGAHTLQETVDLASMVTQAQRAAVLMYRLTR